jgi:uncharacterized membrane protein
VVFKIFIFSETITKELIKRHYYLAISASSISEIAAIDVLSKALNDNEIIGME